MESTCSYLQYMHLSSKVRAVVVTEQMFSECTYSKLLLYDTPQRNTVDDRPVGTGAFL